MRSSIALLLWVVGLSLAAGLSVPQDVHRAPQHPDAADIRSTFRQLLDQIQIDYPVDLDLGYAGDEWGVTDWDEGEEYAHILVWDAYQEDDHGPLWGVAYARCVRASR